MHYVLKKQRLFKYAEELLLKCSSIDVNVQDSDLKTPLHCFLTSKFTQQKISILHLLVRKGADLNMKDANGVAPIDLVPNSGKDVLKTIKKQ